MCFDSKNNVLLGIVKQSFFYHNEETKEKNRPANKKESYRWIEHLRNNNKLYSNAIHVCDREGDIFEMFIELNKLKAQYVIRASSDRTLEENSEKLFQALENASLIGVYEELIHDEIVTLEVKAIKIILAPPNRSAKQRSDNEFIYSSQPVNAVKVSGKMQDGTMIDWVLLTNLSITNFNSCCQIISYYKQRWHVEIFHKVLKTGYSLEEARLENGDNLKKLIATISMEAVFVSSSIYAARMPNPPNLTHYLMPDDEKALSMVMNKSVPLTLTEVVIFIAKKGGFIKTKKYPYPGVLTFFRGWIIVKSQIEIIKTILQSHVITNKTNVIS